MKLLPILTVLALAITTHSASARIGETLEECIQRYGEPTAPAKAGETVMFSKAGMLIGIVFVDGRAGVIIFNKKERLTDTEVSLLMTANSGGQNWEAAQIQTTDSVWRTVDHRIIADRQYADGSLVIFTAAATDHLAAAQKAAAAQRLSGF